jgi:hypothetical protein
MKLLGITLAGVIIGYLLGLQVAETRVVEDTGFFSIFFTETYQVHYGNKGALLGGIIGGVIGLIAQFGD